MVSRLVAFSLHHRVLVFLCVFVLGAVGVRGYLRLTVDAVPDVTGVQVQVLTTAQGYSPLEVEALITRPIEMAMSGLPGAETVRSVSRASVSAVTIVFDEAVPLAEARELVAQRLAGARETIPAGAGRPQMGPPSTSLGEIYHFTLEWPGHPAAELRALLDWHIAYQLRTVPGVVEVNAWGGDTREIEVRLEESALINYGVTAEDVEAALLQAGSNVAGGAIERGDEQILVRLDGQYRSLEQIRQQVVRSNSSGTAVRVGDVATVQDGIALRTSVATADGAPNLYVLVQMVAGGNAQAVVKDLEARLDTLRESLPEGVVIRPFYNRSAFVERVLGTVWKSLGEGGIVVTLVLLLLLGDWRAGLVVASVIPLSMLGAFALMQALDISGNLMSLGAIDFGLVVDGAVVMVEGALATMLAQKKGAALALREDAERYGASIAFGVSMIALVYVPILLLQGVEGKMFRPMALTVLFALGTALVLTFTWVPALAASVLRPPRGHEPRAIALLRAAYGPALRFFLRQRKLALLVGVALTVGGAIAASTRGADFVPRLEEGDLVVQLTRPPSVAAIEAGAGTMHVERALLSFPEVERVVSRTGSPDVATDIMGLEQSDVFVLLRPKSEWTTAQDREGLIAAFEEELRNELPGTAFGFTQPIEMRIQELLGGARSDLGIKIFGEDLRTVRAVAEEVQHALEATAGSSDIRMEPSEGLPLLTVRPRPLDAGRQDVAPGEIATAIETLRAGRAVGIFAEKERRFEVRLRQSAPPAATVDALARMPVPLSGGRVARLGDVASVELEDIPAQLSREDGRRRLLVEANVRGRDLGSFVGELKTRLGALTVPEGISFRVTGQYENLERASARLLLIVPATVVAIFILLYFAFGQAGPASLILLNLPVAASGGFLALAARGLPFSISAAVGFIALFGVATMNGIVLLTAVLKHASEGAPPLEAARLGAEERLRPVVTTAVVASLGFIPMALATGTGAEVQRPLATVVIGGLGTATLLTLLVLPSISAKFLNRWGRTAKAE